MPDGHALNAMASGREQGLAERAKHDLCSTVCLATSPLRSRHRGAITPHGRDPRSAPRRVRPSPRSRPPRPRSHRRRSAFRAPIAPACRSLGLHPTVVRTASSTHATEVFIGLSATRSARHGYRVLRVRYSKAAAITFCAALHVGNTRPSATPSRVGIDMCTRRNERDELSSERPDALPVQETPEDLQV